MQHGLGSWTGPPSAIPFTAMATMDRKNQQITNIERQTRVPDAEMLPLLSVSNFWNVSLSSSISVAERGMDGGKDGGCDDESERILDGPRDQVRTPRKNGLTPTTGQGIMFAQMWPVVEI